MLANEEESIIRVFNIDIAYMDGGKGREQDAEALKLAANAVVRSK